MKKENIVLEVVRASQRWVIKPHTSGADTLGYSYEALSHHMNDKRMLPYLVQIPPSGGRDVEPSSHDGEEFIFILSGAITAQVESENHELGTGDSMYFDPSLKHSFINNTQQSAQLLVCLIDKKMNTHDSDPFHHALKKNYE